MIGPVFEQKSIWGKNSDNFRTETCFAMSRLSEQWQTDAGTLAGEFSTSPGYGHTERDPERVSHRETRSSGKAARFLGRWTCWIHDGFHYSEGLFLLSAYRLKRVVSLLSPSCELRFVENRDKIDALMEILPGCVTNAPKSLLFQCEQK